MRRILLAAAAICAVSAATPAYAKPLLEGTYEIVRAKGRDGKEIDFSKALAQGTTVWARMALTFDGDHLTVSTAMLTHDGGYSACEASVTFTVAWSHSGFSVASDVAAKGVETRFKTLSSSDSDADTKGCTVSFGKGAYAVSVSANTISQKDGTFFLAPTTETDKIDWRKHVR